MFLKLFDKVALVAKSCGQSHFGYRIGLVQ